MKRVFGHVGAGLSALAVAGSVIFACTHDDSTLFIYNAIAPTQTIPGASCNFAANPSQSFIDQGKLDVALGTSYTAVFLVGNQMVAQGDPTKPRTETSNVNIQGAVVRITQADGTPITTYTDLTAGGVAAASGGTPGYVAIAVTIVDQGTVGTLFPVIAPDIMNTVRVITYTKVFGKSLGGENVESNEFEFPVDLCVGCLIDFNLINTNCHPERQCHAGAGFLGVGGTFVPCFTGQDTPTPCTFCLDNGVCNPPPSTVTCSLLEAGTD
jgi:hypothetical protein